MSFLAGFYTIVVLHGYLSGFLLGELGVEKYEDVYWFILEDVDLGVYSWCHEINNTFVKVEAKVIKHRRNGGLQQIYHFFRKLLRVDNDFVLSSSVLGNLPH